MSATQTDDVLLELRDLDDFHGREDESASIIKNMQQQLAEKTKENNDLRSQISLLKAHHHHFGPEDARQMRGPRERFDDVDAIARWGGTRWHRAEHDYPVDAKNNYSCFSSDILPEVVVFNSSKKELTVESIKALSGQEAVFSRLPSRLCNTVFLWFYKMDYPYESTARYRITSNKHSGGGMMQRKAINLSHLSTSVKAKILLGKIKWIFILNPSRPESTSSTRTESSG